MPLRGDGGFDGGASNDGMELSAMELKGEVTWVWSGLSTRCFAEGGWVVEIGSKSVFEGVWDRCVLLSFEVFGKGDLAEESWVRGKFDVKKKRKKKKREKNDQTFRKVESSIFNKI